jgi:hypothetical protein
MVMLQITKAQGQLFLGQALVGQNSQCIVNAVVHYKIHGYIGVAK